MKNRNKNNAYIKKKITAYLLGEVLNTAGIGIISAAVVFEKLSLEKTGAAIIGLGVISAIATVLLSPNTYEKIPGKVIPLILLAGTQFAIITSFGNAETAVILLLWILGAGFTIGICLKVFGKKNKNKKKLW